MIVRRLICRSKCKGNYVHVHTIRIQDIIIMSKEVADEYVKIVEKIKYLRKAIANQNYVLEK